MLPFDLIAGSRYAYEAGTGDKTLTIPAGSQVWSISVRAGATDATMTIAPGGANQPSTAGPAYVTGNTITIVAGSSFSRDFLGQLGGGTVFTIVGSVSWFADYFQPKTGAAHS